MWNVKSPSTTVVIEIEGSPTPVPPYGVAIHEAIASGDLNRMKAMAHEVEAWLEARGDVSAALPALKSEIARLS